MSTVIIVGAGNAGLCAAISAREHGADVVVLESAPRDSYGSDSFFSGGLFRVSYESMTQLEEIVGETNLDGAIGAEDFERYAVDEFLADWGRVTGYRCDPDLSHFIVEHSFETLRWMSEHGVPFESPIVVDEKGRARHGRPGWHGGFVEVSGAGPGLTDALFAAATKAGAEVEYGIEARDLDRRADGSWTVIGRRRSGERVEFNGDRVILASGGFQADVEWRTRCLGPGWDLAKVRGSAHNNGRGMRAALDAGAASDGNWSGCHAVAWSVGSGDAGRADANHVFERESYPFGITVNSLGERFIDEGSDFGAYTYAKYGREILKQPAQTAWQLFDQHGLQFTTSEYRYKNPEAARVRADTIEGLAKQLASRGVDDATLVRTVEGYNAAVRDDQPFSPYVKDGRGTVGLTFDKTNWAEPLVTPPFEAYEVTCGITFTFGGLRVDTDSRVLDHASEPIDGLFACGENVGRLHYFNYASGTGLTSGAVMGRVAGRLAAAAPNA